ncbi:MAG: class I adenylate-forming enzyme family protein [Thermaerobacter sp.]|nr:class I adenylate-forming enzyme family protein [Thermaerobacter sp.]
MLTMGEALATNALRYRDKTALVFDEDRLTYGQFNDRVNQAANLLLALGLSKGDHVAILLPNSLEYAELYFACARMGAVAVPINLRLAPAEMAYVLAHSDSRLLVGYGPLLQAAFAAGMKPGGSLEKVLTVEPGPDGVPFYTTLRDQQPATDPEIPVLEEDPWVLVYTSGTTGKPKGALRSHRSNLMIALLMATDLGITPDDTGLAILPMFHVNSLWLVSLSLALGTTIALYHHKVFHPVHVIEEINRYHATYSMFVPTLLTFLADAAEKGLVDPEQLRVIITSSAPLQTTLRDRILTGFPRAVLADIYGATELGAVTAIHHHPGGVIGSIGMPSLAQSVHILDDEGNVVEQGEVGELHCAGPTLMTAYYKDPEATAKAFKGAYLGVGDLAYQDKQGYLFLVDRKTDMIITSGENVYPTEVEDVLTRHPSVGMAAVVGLADTRRGEEVVAVVSPREGQEISVEALQELCNANLADYKRPRRILVWPELPIGATGKVLRREVRTRVAESAD